MDELLKEEGEEEGGKVDLKFENCLGFHIIIAVMNEINLLNQEEIEAISNIIQNKLIFLLLNCGFVG